MTCQVDARGGFVDARRSGTLTRRVAFALADAAQALGKVPIDVEAMNIDLMSLSSHKIYGPKGIGALYVRRRPRVRLEAIISGGGQERGMRSGTLPTPLCVGFGEACEVAMREMDADHEHVLRLQQRLYDGVSMTVQGVHINGPKPGPDRCDWSRDRARPRPAQSRTSLSVSFF